MLLLVAAVCVTAAPLAPALSGPEEIADTADGRFRIHFTRSGVDDAGDDGDHDGLPDTVGWAERGFTNLLAAFVTVDGWPAPPGDGGLNGDDRIDVYLRALDGNGYAHSVATAAGTSCWMELDPVVASGISPLAFESVAAHELHHCLQFTVSTGLGSWIYEATSTYAQYRLYAGTDPALDLARDFLWLLRLRRTRQPLDDTGQQIEYAAMIWPKFLVDRAGGDRTFLLTLWNAMAAAGDWESGHRAVLPSMAEAVGEHAAWNWFACDRDDGLHYAPDVVACSRAAQVATTTGAAPGDGVEGPVGRWGTGYVGFTPDCASRDLHLEVTPDGAARLLLLEVAAGGVSPLTAVDAAAGETVTFDARDWGWRRDLVLIAVAAADQVSFAWTASVSGTYRAPDLPGAPAGIDVEPAGPLALTVGDRVELVARLRRDTCEDLVAAEVAATWTSSNPEVAMVEDGALVAVGPGSARLVATVGDLTSAAISVEVVEDAGAGCCSHGRGGGGGLAALVAAVAGLLGRRRRPRAGGTAGEC